eukprot:3141266-Karenia_brevis.AAC.1
MLRPQEARSLRFADIILFNAAQLQRYPDVYGAVAVHNSKTRRMSAHAAAQHVLIIDGGLARYIGRVLGTIPRWAL